MMRMCNFVEEKEEEEIEGRRNRRRRGGGLSLVILIVKIRTKRILSIYIILQGTGEKQIRQCLILFIDK